MARAIPFDIQVKLLLIGDESGKTSLLLRYVNDSFQPNPIQTIGIDFKIKTIPLNGLQVKLQIWDSAGHPRFRTITTSYFRGTHAMIIVYDVRKRYTFESVRNWISQVSMYAEKDMPFVIAGNCCDASPHQREVSYEEGVELAAEYGVPFFECSAQNDVNVENVFLTAASKGCAFVGFGKIETLIKEGKLEALMEMIPKLPESQRFTKRDKNGWSMLMLAAKYNQLHIAEWLMSQPGIGVFEKSKDGCTALHIAALYGHLELFQLFENRGCSISSVDNNGANVLMYCAQGTNRQAIVDYCLSNGLDINASDSKSWTALFHAISATQVATVQYLVSKGANIHHSDSEGTTAWILAAQKRSMKLIEYFITEGLQVDPHCIPTIKLFHDLVKGNEMSILSWMLKKGVDVNCQNENGEVALFRANDLKMTTFLLNQGASVNATNMGGNTMLMLTAAKGNQDIIELLLSRGADVNQQNPLTGRTALMEACQSTKTIVELLASRRANLNLVDKDGWTAFACSLKTRHYLSKGDKDIIRWFMTKGMCLSHAVPNAKNNNFAQQHFELFAAVKERNVKKLKECLKDSLLYVDVRDEFGCTPLMLAAKAGHMDVMEILLQHKADVHIIDKRGLNAFAHSIENCHVECSLHLDAFKHQESLQEGTNLPIPVAWISNVSIPPLLRSLVRNNESMQGRVETRYRNMKKEVASIKAEQERRSSTFNFMRFFR